MASQSSASPGRSPTDAVSAVQALVTDIARTARSNGRQDLEERLRAEAGRWSARGTTLVVAGETQRGKSSFINALLGYPDLLPVGDLTSTSVHVVVRFSPTVVVRVHQEGGDASQETVLERIREWVTERDNPSNLHRVQAVEIGLNHPLLAKGLVIVDTPGVGGLASVHAQATLAALAWADALLFVTAAAAPLSAPEVDFLERTAERVESVAVVLTKTDAYPGWRTIVDEDRDILRRRIPAYGESPILAVSSRLKTRADRLAAEGDPELSRELAAESGFEGVVGQLGNSVLGRTQALRLANLLRTAETVIASLELPHQAIIAMSEGTPEAQAAFEANQARLQEYVRAASTALTRLSDAFEIVRIQIGGQLANATADLSRRIRGTDHRAPGRSAGGTWRVGPSGTARPESRLDHEPRRAAGRGRGERRAGPGRRDGRLCRGLDGARDQGLEGWTDAVGRRSVRDLPRHLLSVPHG